MTSQTRRTIVVLVVLSLIVFPAVKLFRLARKLDGNVFFGGGPETAGAKVFVDGELEQECRGPCRFITRLSLGRHRLRVVKAGYKPTEEEISVVPGSNDFRIWLLPADKPETGKKHTENTAGNADSAVRTP